MRWAIPALGAAFGVLLVATRNSELPHIPPMKRTTESLIATLRTPVQEKTRALLAAALAAGIKLHVVQAFRSSAEQAAIYAQGRTKPGAIVSYAKPGTSYHEWGLAFDVAVDKDGQPTWPRDTKLWNQIGALGESVGLTWGGRFPSPDLGHFQLSMPGVGPGKSPAPLEPVA